MKKQILIFLGASIFFSGVFAGIIIEHIRQSDQQIYNFYPQEISEKKIPVLQLLQIENGEISGKILEGKIRLQVNDSPVQEISSKNFSINIVEILPMLKKIPSPSGMNFVASRRGKKFYPLDSPRAFLVSAKNRIFFKTKEEAEKEGYTQY